MRRFGPLKWDFIVTLIVVTCGFAFAVGRLLDPEKRGRRDPFMAFQGALTTTAPLPSPKEEVIDLGCVDRRHALTGPIAVTTGLVRVKGQICDGTRVSFIEGLAVSNSSNGYEGTVFQGRSQTFSTDLVALEKGKNRIYIRWNTNGKQSSERSIAADVYHQP